MKKSAAVLVILLSIIGLYSCQKEIGTKENEQITEKSFNAQEEFSIILSKALHENINLREFLKNEALKHFDKDNDVLYCKSKYELVDGRYTFEEVLKAYDENHFLEYIEAEMPLLNILVPDWSWADGFSVNTWKIEDSDVSVAYRQDESGLSVYNNGKKEFFLENGQISDFPIIIVNQNERVKVRVNTKSTTPSYEFVDSEFDGTQAVETKVTHQYYDRTFETEDYSNFVPATEIASDRSNSAVEAYTLFKNNPYASHRDYIYYGMTNDITAGKLNVHMTEYITKFRFGSLDSEFLFDGDDFKNCPEFYARYVAINDDVLLNKFYYEGNLEVYFKILIGNASGTPTVIDKYKTVSFNDAFQLSKVHVDFKHKTLVSDRKWVYTVDVKCFLPKWINADLQLPKWDISSQSTILNINVSEYDNETEEMSTVSLLNSFTDNFTTEAELEASGKFDIKKIANIDASGKIKIGYGRTNKTETTTTTSTKVKKGSDDLGTALLYYTDPIILSQTTLNGKSGYRVKEINTGYVYMLVVPRYE